MQALALFLSAKVLLMIVASGSYFFIPQEFTSRQLRTGSALLDPWAQYDAEAYVDIAEHGYNGAFMDRRGNYGWYPLYPFLIRALGFLGYYTAAFLIANIASIGAFIALYLLARDVIGTHGAYRTILYLSLFPTAYFLTAMYTESLFLLLSVLAFRFATAGRFAPAGACGFLAALTRTQGMLLVVPVGFLYLQRIRFDARKLNRNALFVLLIPLGFVAFLAYHGMLTGDPLIQFRTHSAFSRGLTAPWNAVAYEISSFMAMIGKSATHSFIHLFNLFVFAALLLFAYESHRRLGPEYGLYVLASALLPAMSGRLEAISRFALVVFPMFMTMALLEQKHARLLRIAYVFSSALLVLFAIRHANEELFF